jgi:hypothetical protein
VKFQRIDLIGRVKAEIERREQAAADHNTDALAKHEQRRREFLEKTAPAWTALADRIRLRVRKGQPITTDDFPQELRADGYVRRVCLVTWDDQPPGERVAEVAELTALLNVLEAATDDEVSTAALERMGFHTSRLFRA